MNREEFIVKWGARMGEFYTDKELSDDLDSLLIWANGMLAYKSLPPAEGATDKFRDVLNEVQRYIETNGGATESEMKAIWNSLSCAITESERRQQPTAEGAEEILEREFPLAIIDEDEWTGGVLKIMREFATLHAQRIADKMVSERLKVELIRFGKVLRSWGIALASDILECSIDEYLKTRDSHDR